MKIIYIILYLNFASCAAIQVSFFGSGYIEMPFQEAKISTNIRLKFKTQQENGLIFLAAGRTDYCMIKLAFGVVHFLYKVNNMLTEISSPAHLKYNDLNWHEVLIKRNEGNISFNINNVYLTRLLPQNSSELNIHYGIVVGGKGEFSDDYLRNVNNFRGCISEVFYNNINILKKAKDGTSYVVCTRIKWECSSQFISSVHETISFTNNDSYAMFPLILRSSEIRLFFEVRTIEENGILFVVEKKTLLCLEIKENKISVSIYQNMKLYELFIETNISNGKWHLIGLRLNQTEIELNVNNSTKLLTFKNPIKVNILELGDKYFFGGVNENVKTILNMPNVNISNISHKGCIRNINMNNEFIGFPNVSVSYNTDINCVWDYPCIERYPCLQSAICYHKNFHDFFCDCDQAYCIRSDFYESYKIFDTKNNMEILHIFPIHIREAETILLNTKIIYVLFNKYLKINDTALLFNTINAPKNGKLTQKNEQLCTNFTYFDLKAENIIYAHNGEEVFKDHIIIDMILPNYVKDLNKLKFRFSINILITPVNDAPLLLIPTSSVINVVQGVKKVIGTDLLNIIDPDSPLNLLLYTIIYSNNTGRFMINDTPVNNFSHYQVAQGQIEFLYNEIRNYSDSFNISLQVSDGIETSDNLNISIIAHQLKFKIIYNTGLIILYNSSSIISNNNLSITTNCDEGPDDIRYNITNGPSFGIIEKFRPIDSSWLLAKWFTNQQILLGFIRYRHTHDYPLQDNFKFVASQGITSSRTFDFRIFYTKLKIIQHNLTELFIDGIKEIHITNNELNFQTSPFTTLPYNIKFIILENTQYGNLYIGDSTTALKKMDYFTQYDIEMNLVKYMTYKKSYSSFFDILKFRIDVGDCDPIHNTLNISYIPHNINTNLIIQQNKSDLIINEGEKSTLKNEHFDFSFENLKNMNFVIAKNPLHGSVCKYSYSEKNCEPISKFVLNEIKMGIIYYCHDGSETENDFIDMLIYSSDMDMQLSSNLTIKVTLLNDNSPQRLNEKMFRIERNTDKYITMNDLMYIDDDINTSLKSIVYSHVSANNGEFLLNGKLSNYFSQEDISKNKVKFLHKGSDNGTAFFIVTDGKHEMSGSLDIQASDPYILVLPSAALIIQEGTTTHINKTYFPIETNMNFLPNEVMYELIEKPLYGFLVLNNWDHIRTFNECSYDNNSIDSFTLRQIEREELFYCNTKMTASEKIRYKVRIGNQSAHGELLLRIFPLVYWEPLKVVRQNILYVEESSSQIITQDILQVKHNLVSPSDISYIVSSPPLHGYLEIQSIYSDDDSYCRIFDQLLINNEKVFYIQTNLNQVRDSITFDVTNGVTWLHNLKLEIHIIPDTFIMEADMIHVTEGMSIKIHSSHFAPQSDYYKAKILEYKIIDQPLFGFISSGAYKINRFSQKQLDNGNINYINDGSNQVTDFVKLTAVTKNKESLPFVLNISITPVNDEPPVVVINNTLEVWNGGTYKIQSSDLLTKDNDSSSDTIIYVIENVNGGHLISGNNKLKTLNFTQSQIDDGDIFFVHYLNSKINDIRFYVSDGLFNTSSIVLNISVKSNFIIPKNNQNLKLFPLSKAKITQHDLYYTCSNEMKYVIYKVTKLPQLGMVVEYNPVTDFFTSVSSFTQENINDGLIFYENTDFFSDFKANDFFLFNATIDEFSMADQKFNIEILLSSQGLLQYLTIEPLYLNEGESKEIELNVTKTIGYLKSITQNRNIKLYISVQQNTSNGFITGKNLINLNRLYPSDFFEGKVIYVHDHSDTIGDQIDMSIFLEKGNVLLCHFTMPVIINPVNDQIFVLVTKEPFINVIEGEESIITNIDLYTRDDDTFADGIIYEIIKGPDIGKIIDIRKTGKSLKNFTQSDINNNNIKYLHDGMPISTYFLFSVSDGYHKSVTGKFEILIEPVYFHKAKNNYDILLKQGESVVSIIFPHNLYKTNAKLHRINFNITNSPESGIILLKNQPTLHFNYQQLENNEIIYMQTDLTKSNDTFEITVNLNKSKIFGIYFKVQVIVEPIFKIATINTTTTNQLSLKDHIMTGKKIERYNPKFVITKHPLTGNIIRMPTGLENKICDSRLRINHFKLNDIKSGIIHFCPNENITEHLKTDDYFEYVLSIRASQPAQYKVQIKYNTENTLSANTNYGIYIAILICILIIAALIVCNYVIKNRRKRPKDVDYAYKDICPPSLPHPPNFAFLKNELTFNIKCMRSSNVPQPQPGVSNIPNYKIISIVTDMELQKYAAEQEKPKHYVIFDQINEQKADSLGSENWISSYDISRELDSTTASTESKINPMLRRNQYWV